MKTLIISTSHRANANSTKVAHLLDEQALTLFQDIDSEVLALHDYQQLLHHYDTLQDEERGDALQAQKQKLLEKLYAADALVFVVPEWGGMPPPALINLFLLTANGSAGGMPFGHKPGFIIGVSASAGGAYPISMLKGYAGKNSHITWISLHAIIRNVEEFLQLEWQPSKENRHSQVQDRIQTGLEALLIYAKQLQPIRDELVKLSQKYPFGQ